VLWEAVFLLVILKIPVVYLCAVVWWAIRSEPRPEQPVASALPAPVSDTPPPAPGWSPKPRDRRRPAHPRPPRRPAGPRVSAVRAEATR
jgi:hypothetical protein